ncbi:hypothetical protein [Brevibacillus massiliensis]|uniref:hypothetical protein n=1 Tax=Brevibacillus massiliensis TaxID=1118054 RepID=UPI00035E6020|nr:hypothetical protein [Brevibacillus massiliensis]
MPKVTRKPELRLTLDPEIYNALMVTARQRGDTLNNHVRKILQSSISRDAAENGIDYVSQIIRQTIRDLLRPVEERLAKINAKTAITSGTAMYMAMQVIEEAGYDSHGVYQQARKKAAAYLAEKEGGD